MPVPTGTVSLSDLRAEFKTPDHPALVGGVKDSLRDFLAGGRNVPSGYSQPEESVAPKAFYSWDDRFHENVVDYAQLTSSSLLGSLTGSQTMPTDFSDAGCIVGGNVDLGPPLVVPTWLAYSPSVVETALRAPDRILEGFGLVEQVGDLMGGFTLHYEIEVSAMDLTTTLATRTGPTSFGGLWRATAFSDITLTFNRDRKPAGADGVLPEDAWASGPMTAESYQVQTKHSPQNKATHAEIDLSFTSLNYDTGKYRLDVYIDKTLWWTAEADGFTAGSPHCLLSGTGGIFGPLNTQSRIRNVLLIRGPVNLTINPQRCITIGDSNLWYMTLQTLGQDPLVNKAAVTARNYDRDGGTSFTDIIAAGGSLASANEAGNVFLNQELLKKGVTPVAGDGQFKVDNYSISGWTIQTRNLSGLPPSGLKIIVNEALTLSPLPKYWFCNMGVNDVGVRGLGAGDTEIEGVDYPVESEWITKIIDLYIVQIQRILSASSDTKVFITSPARQYDIYGRFGQASPAEFEDAANYIETDNSKNLTRAFVSELDVRIRQVNPERVFYTNIYADWTPDYHVAPLGEIYLPQVHYNLEGYRQVAKAYGRIIPNESLPLVPRRERFLSSSSNATNLNCYRGLSQHMARNDSAYPTSVADTEFRLSMVNFYGLGMVGLLDPDVMAKFPDNLTRNSVIRYSGIPFLCVGLVYLDYAKTFSVVIYGNWLTGLLASEYSFTKIYILGMVFERTDAVAQVTGEGLGQGTTWTWSEVEGAKTAFFENTRANNLATVYPVFS